MRRRPLILRKSGLKILGRRNIKSQTLDAMLRSLHFAWQGTGTIGELSLLFFPKMRACAGRFPCISSVSPAPGPEPGTE